jgi:hypothetical protein
MSLKQAKDCPDEKESAKGECVPVSIGSAPYLYIKDGESALRASASHGCIERCCIARECLARQYRPNLSRLTRYRQVLCESEEGEGESQSFRNIFKFKFLFESEK